MLITMEGIVLYWALSLFALSQILLAYLPFSPSPPPIFRRMFRPYPIHLLAVNQSTSVWGVGGGGFFTCFQLALHGLKKYKQSIFRIAYNNTLCVIYSNSIVTLQYSNHLSLFITWYIAINRCLWVK